MVGKLFSVVMVVVVVIVNRYANYLKSKTNTVLSDVSAEINTPNLLGSNPFVVGSSGTNIDEPGLTFGCSLNPKNDLVRAARPFA